MKTPNIGGVPETEHSQITLMMAQAEKLTSTPKGLHFGQPNVGGPAGIFTLDTKSTWMFGTNDSLPSILWQLYIYMYIYINSMWCCS